MKEPILSVYLSFSFNERENLAYSTCLNQYINMFYVDDAVHVSLDIRILWWIWCTLLKISL